MKIKCTFLNYFSIFYISGDAEKAKSRLKRQEEDENLKKNCVRTRNQRKKDSEALNH